MFASLHSCSFCGATTLSLGSRIPGFVSEITCPLTPSPPLADSRKPATLEVMETSSKTTALVPVDPRRRTVLSIRERLVGLHGALIVAEQLTYERINGPVQSMDSLLELLQKDPW